MSLFRFTQWISEGRPVLIFGDGTITQAERGPMPRARAFAAGYIPGGTM